MYVPEQRSKKIGFALKLAMFILLAFAAARPQAYGEDMGVQPLPEGYEPSPRKQALALDVYRQQIHQELTVPLRPSEVVRYFKRGELPALDVNAFDEVPDSLFFENRHGKSRLSKDQLLAGPSMDGQKGPADGPLQIFKGKNMGVNTGLWIEDSKGDRFLLKFDPLDYNELASSAESISSRVFYAIGYHVPEYDVVRIKRDRLTIKPDAYFYNDDGFKEPLTMDALDRMLENVAQLKNNEYRASASKFISGRVLGRDEMDMRRRKDQNDTLWHRDRRTFRALRVFASWVNYYDLVPQNTMESVQEIDGKRVIKHYIIDFGSSLGSAGRVEKPPVYGFEYLLDYGDMFKSFITLGFWKKDWQKRFDEGAAGIYFNSVGSFDNRYFDPGKWKTMLPVHAFKELTPADAFWAAKIILSFSDEDIRTLVSAGELSDEEAARYVADTLIERRDLIGKYWFDRVTPLDDFKVAIEGENLSLAFENLSVAHGFSGVADVLYDYKVYYLKDSGKRSRLSVRGELLNAPLQLTEGHPAQTGSIEIVLSARQGQASKARPPVHVFVTKGDIVHIYHE